MRKSNGRGCSIVTAKSTRVPASGMGGLRISWMECRQGKRLRRISRIYDRFGEPFQRAARGRAGVGQQYFGSRLSTAFEVGSFEPGRVAGIASGSGGPRVLPVVQRHQERLTEYGKHVRFGGGKVGAYEGRPRDGGLRAWIHAYERSDEQKSARDWNGARESAAV